jgi:hypothetical protein
MPCVERHGVGDQRFAQVFRKTVHDTTWHSLTHRRTLAGGAAIHENVGYGHDRERGRLGACSRSTASPE